MRNREHNSHQGAYLHVEVSTPLIASSVDLSKGGCGSLLFSHTTMSYYSFTGAKKTSHYQQRANRKRAVLRVISTGRAGGGGGRCRVHP